MRREKPQPPFEHPYSAQEKFLNLKGIERQYVCPISIWVIIAHFANVGWMSALHYRDCAHSWQHRVGREEGLQERLSYVVCSDLERGASHKNPAAGLTSPNVRSSGNV
jgi:hypothetical protein